MFLKIILFNLLIILQATYSCEDAYFSSSYEEFVKQKFTESLNIFENINETCPKKYVLEDTVDICYSYQACNSYTEHNSHLDEPHPLYAALLYKLRNPEKGHSGSISYGETCGVLNELNNEKKICDQKKFNNSLQLNYQSTFNINIKLIGYNENYIFNTKYINEYFEEGIKSFILTKWDNFDDFIKEIDSGIENLSSVNAHPNIKTQYQIVRTLCEKSNSMIENNFYNKLNISDYLINAENTMDEQKMTSLIQKTNTSYFFAMDRRKFDFNAQEKNKEILHGYTLVARKSNLDNNKQCEYVFRDSDPHFSKDDCSDNVKLYPTEFDSKTNSCYYTLTSEELFTQNNNTFIKGFCSAEIKSTTTKNTNTQNVDNHKKSNSPNQSRILFCGLYNNTTNSINNLTSVGCTPFVREVATCPKIRSNTKYAVFCETNQKGAVKNGDYFCNTSYKYEDCH